MEMKLLDFPIPKLEVTLGEASRVLQLTLDPQQYSDYESTLSHQKGVLQDMHAQLAATASRHENWVTDQFKCRLLSCREPLPTSTAVPAVLAPSRSQRTGVPAERAAALLWAVARLCTEPQLVEGEAPTERTQQSEIFSASRLPGKSLDQIQVFPDSLHAILICHGGIFPVQILCRPNPGVPPYPLPFLDIYSQVAEAANWPQAAEEQDPAIICGFSTLPRQDWHALRQRILDSGGEAAVSLELMESAVVALTLDNSPPPPGLAETLNKLRLGRDDGRCLRYYDKVMNIVVFQDSTAGVVFEHSAVDGMVASLVTESVWHLSESLQLSQLLPEAGLSPQNILSTSNSLSLHPLSFPLQAIRQQSTPTPQSLLQASHPIMTFEVPSYPDIFSTLRAHRALFDAWVNFSLQLALWQTLRDSAKRHILVTPTHMRHYKHGRCDPTFTSTVQSHQLLKVLMSCTGPSNTLQHTKDLLCLFHQAFQEHKHLIKNTKSGQGVGPHLAALRLPLSQDNPLKKFLDPFGCPSVYLTGKDLMEGVECAVGNVYAQDQLAVTYLGRRDRVRMVLNGKGSFANVLDQLQENLKNTLKLMMLLALRYAIAAQMGALECWLHDQDDMTEKENPVTEAGGFNQQKASSGLTADMKSDFTLLIHGGAGEDMTLKQNEINMIEFSLQSALMLGARELGGGGSSLNAVERCVSALEDCFLFNAGKGSVFNREGRNEMEATIVDGSELNSGSVACVKTVKNPVKAARKVMEKSPHGLLVGDGAEAFLQCLDDKEKPMGAEYFHTDVRHKELKMKLMDRGTSRSNHPQTVGAVALDRHGKLAAATSTGGLVGKCAGRVGDTAVVGAGIFADAKLAVTCSGDGDVFLRRTVAHKVASLYHHKGHSLQEACKEVISEHLKGSCAGIIAVDACGDTAIECNAGVMFVGSIIRGTACAQVIRPLKTYSNVIWETDKLVAYLHSEPWTPGATILTQKNPNMPNSIFHLPEQEFLELLLGAKTVANLLCEQLEVQHCALVFKPQPERAAHIRLLPLHGLEPNWKPHLAEEMNFQYYDPGYCTSKNGPLCEDAELKKVQAKIRSYLSTPDTPPSYKFLGDPSHDNLFSRIVRGEEKQWRVWESSEHVAFLTPFPSAPGFTVLVPRRPLPSNIFCLEEDDYKALVLASREVAHLLKKAMGAHGVALIFEGYEIDYAHAKLIPLLSPPENFHLSSIPQFCSTYQGYVTSADGPLATPDSLKEIQSKVTRCKPPQSWKDPEKHADLAVRSQWYRQLFKIQDTLFHSTVEFFHNICRYAYALTPITTDTISSPMGLGSDSEPVHVNMLGQDVYLADSMQFILEYFLRFQEGLRGTYYVSPSFRGEDPDATHLNQFYHVECELPGDMEMAMHVAENYVAHLTHTMLKKHSDIILVCAGTLFHAQSLLKSLDGQERLPRVTLEQALPMMPSEDCFEWVQDGQPQYGKKLTRKGEQVLIRRYGGAVWLTEMDHLGVPFYQAYVEGSGKQKAKAADLLLGLGETIGLGERHSTPEMVQEALRHHAVPEESYKWYIQMRQMKALLSSGWGMGTERYLCWLLQHDDVRDMHIIPRLKAKKYMP
ncbi:uncharacterized protein si:ch211-256m1.8 [Brienomyrus brachyistius]|uniref:uncharacterized protein si:ch211-256m1.8 n=1 Tax=Brienomyrus brachyistius TaxID=42636 RepID=UPI0020B2ED53|nr:uncharacterized protein si:ch211-256m1.8 [Brienomyrus brachyistius]XP_048846542.1 uncharacterized protein si:ch211-256m1.8 [Brienomyrus brachyistius]